MHSASSTTARPAHRTCDARVRTSKLAAILNPQTNPKTLNLA